MYLSNVALMKAEQLERIRIVSWTVYLFVHSSVFCCFQKKKKTNESYRYVVSVNLSWIFFQLLKSLRLIFLIFIKRGEYTCQ